MKKYLDSLTTGLIFSKHPDKSMLVQTDLKVLGQFSRLNAHKLSGRYIATQIFHPLQAYPPMIKCQIGKYRGVSCKYPRVCFCLSVFSLFLSTELRIQFKLNTALLSYCPFVCPSVCHRRDISHFSHI